MKWIYFSLPGQRVRLSKGDILQTTALYQCPGCGKTYQVTDLWILNILLEDFEYFPLQETSAKFGSPQYAALYSAASGADPQPFKKGDKCEWRILATHGEKIILNITNLDIPPSANCQLDYLEVHRSRLLFIDWSPMQCNVECYFHHWTYFNHHICSR